MQKKKDEDLFQVDVAGDDASACSIPVRSSSTMLASVISDILDAVRKTLPKFSERVLTSTKILSQRSAVPAVFSRATENAVAGTKRKAVTHDDKSRLLRMGKRLRKGPFNAFVDPNQVGEGSAMLELSEAAKKAGTYDVWAEEAPERVPVKVCLPIAEAKSRDSGCTSRFPRHLQHNIPDH